MRVRVTIRVRVPNLPAVQYVEPLLQVRVGFRVRVTVNVTVSVKGRVRVTVRVSMSDHFSTCGSG